MVTKEQAIEPMRSGGVIEYSPMPCYHRRIRRGKPEVSSDYGSSWRASHLDSLVEAADAYTLLTIEAPPAVDLLTEDERASADWFAKNKSTLAATLRGAHLYNLACAVDRLAPKPVPALPKSCAKRQGRLEYEQSGT